jgi:hypothetical protein
MRKSATAVTISVLVLGVATGQPCRAAQSEPSQAADPIKCEYVVSADPGSKPTQMCLPQSQWAAKKKQDAADATRIVCHYEEEPGTRFASRKICMSAAQWDDRKLQDRQDVERIQLQSAGRGP